MTLHTGRHFLQIPGPTNVPDRVLRAMDMPTMDHRGVEFAELGHAVLAGCQRIFRTKQPVIIYPASGTGAWEAAIVNALSPGDKVLMAETGQFAVLWLDIARKFKLDVEFLPTDWRRGADVNQIEARLAADRQHKIKAVCVVHNETSTSCVTHPLEVRKALDRANHPALLMVDTISGLASLEYEHDAWGIDISVAGSQKGMMLPAGLSFNAVSEKALAASKANASLRSYWEGSHHDAGGGGARQRLRPAQASWCGCPRGRQGMGSGTGLPRSPQLFAGIDGCHGRGRTGRRRFPQGCAG
jgi:alanine-glyoxylate transaminase / serine-glyoxylate transaminase / serine-pyruvate transaminase